MSDKILSKLFLIPIIICIILFILYPIYLTVSFSIYDQLIYSDFKVFTGLENYKEVLVDKNFWVSLGNSGIWTFGSIILQFFVGIIIAVLLNESFPGRNITRSIVLFSYVVTEVVAALVWRYMLSESTGIINYVIREFFHLEPPLWFSSRFAMVAVIILNVWKFFPFMVIVFLAQLQSIDQQQYEAARIDGANWFREFFYITLPALKPVIIIALMLRTIFTFKNFNLVQLFTGGGPLNYTTTLPIQVFKTTFETYYLGKGAAMGMIMFLIIFSFSFIYLRLYSKVQKEL